MIHEEVYPENLHLKLQKYRRDGQAKIEKGSVIANSISVKYLNLTILEVLLIVFGFWKMSM